MENSQERLAEAGKIQAGKEQQEADKEERASARLRIDLRRRESEALALQDDLARAHEALEAAAQVMSLLNVVLHESYLVAEVGGDVVGPDAPPPPPPLAPPLF